MLFEAAPPSADDLSVRSCTLPRRGKHSGNKEKSPCTLPESRARTGKSSA